MQEAGCQMLVFTAGEKREAVKLVTRLLANDLVIGAATPVYLLPVAQALILLILKIQHDLSIL